LVNDLSHFLTPSVFIVSVEGDPLEFHQIFCVNSLGKDAALIARQSVQSF